MGKRLATTQKVSKMTLQNADNTHNNIIESMNQAFGDHEFYAWSMFWTNGWKTRPPLATKIKSNRLVFGIFGIDRPIAYSI